MWSNALRLLWFIFGTYLLWDNLIPLLFFKTLYSLETMYTPNAWKDNTKLVIDWIPLKYSFWLCNRDFEAHTIPWSFIASGKGNYTLSSFVFPNITSMIFFFFVGTNYLNWTTQFLPPLCNHDLVSIVDGFKSYPSQFISDDIGTPPLTLTQLIYYGRKVTSLFWPS